MKEAIDKIKMAHGQYGGKNERYDWRRDLAEKEALLRADIARHQTEVKFEISADKEGKMKKTCKDCKFWEEGTARWGSCKIGESKSGERLFKESKAYAEDYESYMAELITETDFGCCMFQEKKDKDNEKAGD